ncbi:MAG TPA: GIY-YIG nuclease family protein [Candidatus Saccharimonadales bacterium]|nr:GIY-YIG nuclease family protein [Candidatus Saccharimonadales bacterium]
MLINNKGTKSIRNWSLYVIKFQSGDYYVGITSRRDFMIRINQHGSDEGARINLGKQIDSIVEIQHLGKMTMMEAQNIENDMTLEYRKKYGWGKVKGGYDISFNSSIFPTFTPGSQQATIFILSCLFLAVGFLAILLITKT